jgi:hypothetical protein
MSEDTENAEETPVEVPGEASEALPEAGEAPEFNLKDLLAVKQIVEVGARRGAWNAAEMSAVGITYDRLMRFLRHHLPATEPAQQEVQADVPDVPEAPAE